MVDIFVGTSGWYYSQWNPDLSLDWYIQESGLNAIELNASFYRFPFPNQIKSWAKKGAPLRWVVKVHRSITHFMKFKGESFERWQRFKKAFQPLDKLVDFYLFQLPPSLTPNARKEIETFYKKTRLGGRFALEWRHLDWFTDEHQQWGKDLGLTLVSVDAPKLPRDILCSNGNIYIRLHGRDQWYDYNYSARELSGLSRRIRAVKARSVYAFANNDEHMLDNARDLLKRLRIKRTG